MILEGAFIKLEPAECENALAEINPALAGGPFDPASVTMLGQELAFYPGYRFLDIADYEATPHLRKFVIYRPGEVHVLDWTSAPIYALNGSAPLHLTLETAADYVRFFFTYTRGPHGRFMIVENVDDIIWDADPPPAARKAIGNMLQPVNIVENKAGNGFDLTACLLFGNILYSAIIEIEPGGRVSLRDEQILADDMPVRDDTLRL